MFAVSLEAKLRSLYIDTTKPTMLNERFVQLRLQQFEEETLPETLTYRDVEYLEMRRQSGQVIELQDLFSKLTHDDVAPQKVLIRGRAGVGKTTLIEFISREWATHNSWLQFGYVFVIKLRLVSDVKWSIGDILFRGLQLSRKEKEAALDEICQQSKRVLVIVDSLDEFPQFKYSEREFDIEQKVHLSMMVSSIINCTLLPDSTVVITSRHTDQIPSKMFSRVVDIYGFTMEGIETYVNKFCNGKEDLNEFIWTNIAGNPNMATFCHTPVQCLFVCNSLEDQFTHSDSKGGRVPDIKTMTQLYLRATHRLGKKLHPVLKNHQEEAGLKYVFDILMEPFRKHACLAKDCMTDPIRILFYDDDLERHGFSNQDKLTGFLSGSKKTDPDDREEKLNTWSFSHLSLQEFFSSLGLLLQYPYTDLSMLLEKENMVKRYEIVITFLAGLLGDRSNSYYLKYMNLDNESFQSCKEFIVKLKDKLVNDPLKLVNFIYETQRQELVGNVPEQIETSKIYPMEMLSLCWILVMDKCPITNLK